jgi:hypothetical protein
MTSTTSQCSSSVSSEEGTSHTGKVHERQVPLVPTLPPEAEHILAENGIITGPCMLEAPETLGLIRLNKRKKECQSPREGPTEQYQ